MTRLLRPLSLGAVVLALAGCDRDLPVPRAAAAEAPAAAQGDTLLPMADMITRFQAALTGAVTALAGSASSRDELVARFVAAVEAADADALRALRLDIAEFAWLYFPESRYTRPPYELPPETLWLLIEQNGLKGESRLLRLYGGTPLQVLGYACEDEPRIENGNRLWEHCVVRRRDPDGTALEERLFGSIIERDGHFKFVSLANRL